MPIFCRNCGNQLKDNAKFCTNCGAKAETEQAPVIQNLRAEPIVPESAVPQQSEKVEVSETADIANAKNESVPTIQENQQPQKSGNKSLIIQIILIILILAVIVVDIFLIFSNKLFGTDNNHISADIAAVVTVDNANQLR